ncbi:MAG: hypothetical protein L3J59_13580 [Methylococcaceae bacterium]|nr:hypothetical protein [Methylococcaceae bacterium]
MRHEYEKKGLFMVKSAINEDEIKILKQALNIFEKEVNHYGIRDLMNKLPCIRELALSAPLLSIVKEILGVKSKPIRAVFFDKLPSIIPQQIQATKPRHLIPI